MADLRIVADDLSGEAIGAADDSIQCMSLTL